MSKKVKRKAKPQPALWALVPRETWARVVAHLARARPVLDGVGGMPLGEHVRSSAELFSDLVILRLVEAVPNEQA